MLSLPLLTCAIITLSKFNPINAHYGEFLSDFEVEQKFMKRLNEINYDKSMLPPVVEKTEKNSGDHQPVKVGLINNILQMMDLDGKSEAMAVSMFLSMQWVDKRLAFADAPEFKGLLKPEWKSDLISIIVPVDNIWIPQVYLVNSADGNFDFSQKTHALIYGSGLIYWMPPGLYNTNCPLKVDLFPYRVILKKNC